MHLDVGGGLEGLVIGAAAGLGYAAATTFAEGGLAAPRGGRRIATAAVVGLACAAATLALALSGRALVGGTVHLIAAASQGSQVVLTPLGRLVGEPDFGPVSAAILGTGEGLLFGAGLAFGLTRRPDRRRGGAAERAEQVRTVSSRRLRLLSLLRFSASHLTQSLTSR